MMWIKWRIDQNPPPVQKRGNETFPMRLWRRYLWKTRDVRKQQKIKIRCLQFTSQRNNRKSRTKNQRHC